MKQYLWLLLGMITAACSQTQDRSELKKIKFEGEAQGTYYAVTYFAADTLVSQPAIDSLLDAFNLCASIYEPKSIISAFNRNDSVVVADSMFTEIFEASQKASEITGGAFDITVGQVVNAWGFGFKNRENVTPAMIDSLLPLTGYQKVRLENGRLIKEDPRIMIDFNAVAQGYSVDLLAGFLEKRGISIYLIDIGGEVKGKGKKPDGQHWVVAIEKPTEDMYSERELQAKLHLADRSLATSGSYRKYYEEGGVRYSHTIDPSTGYPVKHNMLSVSVIAGDCMTADIYATAFMVMGLERTRDFLQKNHGAGLEVYCIYSTDKGMETWISPGFEQLLLRDQP